MSNVIPFCVFCRKKKETLKLFTEETLKKCNDTLVIRKNNNLIGKDVILPAQITDFYMYHSSCYRRFTALPPKYRVSKSAPIKGSSSSIEQQQQSEEVMENMEIDNVTLGEDNPEVVEDSELAAEKMDEDVAPGDSAEPDNTIEGNKICTCFFCEKHRKKVKGREEKLSVLLSNSITSIRALATESGDIDMNQRLQQLPLDGEYFYHKSCKNIYFNSRHSKLSTEKNKSEWHVIRDIRAEAYEKVEQFVAEKIVSQEQSFFLKFLNDMFIKYLKNNDTPVANTTLKPYHLKERLLKKFSKEINIISFKGDSIVKPYKGIMIKNEAHRDEILDAAALILHEEILKIKTNKIPAEVKTKDLIEGEAKVPVIISQFQKKIIAGTNSGNKKKAQK